MKHNSLRTLANRRRRRRIPRCALGGVLGLALPVLCAQAVRADTGDSFNIVAGISAVYDDNLFRLPPGVDPQPFLGESTKADINTISSVSLRFNKPYSLQRIELEATAVNSRYQTFDYLNFTAFNYNGAWRWALTPYFHGNLTASRVETPNSYEQYTGYRIKNLRTTENQRFDGVLELDGVWRLVGGVARSTSTNSEIFVQEGDSRINSADAAIRYDFLSGSSLSYRYKAGHGEYTNRPVPIPVVLLDNRFDDVENAILLKWRLTAKTTIDARVGHFQRTSADFSQRSFGGNVGNLNVNWEITSKTGLAASIAQDLTSYQQLSSSYIRARRFSLDPYWQMSAKTALRFRYAFSRSEYLGAIAPTPLNGRVDDLSTAMIAFEWQPTRTAVLSASVQSQKRDSNLPNFDYHANMIYLMAQLTF